jgi:4-amino-4-deoxy-L-arabinose transferase-like glycosyltransferase
VLLPLALAVRLVYAWQLAGGPCLRQHLWVQSDMSFFDAWARVIAAGDWLTDRELHPYHSWHEQLARRYFADYPQEHEALERAAAERADGSSPASLLWLRWYGGKQLHQEPLYPYLVAATYALLGPDVRWVFAWQVLLGLATCALVYQLARRLFGTAAGLLAGLGAALCPPLVFHELLLLRETLLTCLGCAAVLLTLQALERGRARWWLFTGVLLGIAILVKSTFLLYLLGVAGALAWRGRGALRTQLGTTGTLLLGAGLCLLPALARNALVGAPVLSLSSVGPIGFVLTNSEDFGCGPGQYEPGGAHVGRIMHDTGSRALPLALATLRTHASAGGLLAQWWRKASGVWHGYEVPDNANLHYFALHAALLRWLPVRFLTVAPLSIAGMLLCWSRRRMLWPLYLLVATGYLPLVVFGNLARYRLPLLAALLVFAAAALVQIFSWVRERRFLPVASIGALVALLTLYLARPLAPGLETIRVADYFAPLEFHYGPLAERAAERGDFREAASVLAEALVIEPERVRRLGPDRSAASAYEAELGAGFAQVHLVLADYLRRAGQPTEAFLQEQRGAELLRAARAAG